MAYDAVNMADWQISEAAEENMPTPEQWQEKLGLQKEEMLPMGRLAKIDFLKVIDRLKDRPDGKYIEVTAITPTPLGEGKSTTSVGLMEGLGMRGKNVGGALRQPSGGPTMNVKGTAAGGGNSLLIPMTEFSLGLTGDINDIMNAHNLGMVAMTARMQHERNYNDEQLARLTGMRRLDIDPTRVEMGWIIDFCAQALRNIVIGLGGRTDGFTMQSKFGIASICSTSARLSQSRRADNSAAMYMPMATASPCSHVPYPAPVSMACPKVCPRFSRARWPLSRSSSATTSALFWHERSMA